MASSQETDQAKAMWQVGMFQRIDLVLLALIIALWATFFARHLMGQPTFAEVFSWAVAAIGMTLIWLVALTYRAIWFVLQIMAEIKLMPSNAARLALAFQRGQATDARQNA